MAPLANSISLRLVGFLLGAVVLFNLAMAVAFFAPIGRDRASAERLPLPAQAAAIVEVLEAASPKARPRLLDALNSASMSVRLVDVIPATAADGTSAPILTRFLDSYDEAFASRDVHVDLQRRGGFQGFRNRRDEEWRPVRLYVRLRDGPWVAMEPMRSVLLRGVLGRGLAIVGLVGLIVIVLLVIAVRQTARPIEKLAATARMFAERLDAPDLETKGPKELRELASSFNDMKRRIRLLVQERTRLVAAIAHDLRTYLTRLRMRAEFIADASQRERAERDIEEMSELIGDTLLFARTTEKRDERQARADVVAETIAFAAARKELGEAVIFAPPTAPAAQAVVDPVALRRILANLTDNALRYGAAAELAVSLEPGWVIIEVADRGPGIPDAEIDRILAPFERLEPSRGREEGGSGLGLAIVKALTESHGGIFKLANRPGGGVCAHVSLKSGGSPISAPASS
ncbi:MAG: ATP-binding protein [Hyphomonadaceae bacterium]|nr:ATP-binding protein [Hyphomonadaceae bacterium]